MFKISILRAILFIQTSIYQLIEDVDLSIRNVTVVRKTTVRGYNATSIQ